MAPQELNNNGISGRLSPGRAERAGFLRSNLFLIGLFALGILSVYVLGLREPPQSASGQRPPASITAETQLRGTSKSDSTGEAEPGKGTAVVDTFYHQAKQRQIPIEALTGNPFVRRSRRLAAPSPPRPTVKGGDAESKSLKEAMARVRKLKLQSVLRGPGGATAMISGHLLTEGQEIQGWTVARIEARRVVLAWRDREVGLTMSE